MSVSLPLAIVGILLVFILPGFTIAKAVFPERRIRGADGPIWGIELAAITLVLSVVVTILMGFALLVGGPSGFAADWSDPALEAGLAAVSVVAGAVGLVRGSYSAAPPAGPPLEPSHGAEGAWEEIRAMEGLVREERRRLHRLRTTGAGSSERATIEHELETVRAEIRRRREAREAEYAR